MRILDATQDVCVQLICTWFGCHINTHTPMRMYLVWMLVLTGTGVPLAESASTVTELRQLQGGGLEGTSCGRKSQELVT
jgi:hypothetical protein